MGNNMSLSDKYKREAERNANLTKRLVELLKKLADKNRLIIQQDKVIEEVRVKLVKLKQQLSKKMIDKNHNL